MSEIYASLMGAGLSELESRAYVTLLHKKHFTATQLANAVGISRTQTYMVLAGLIQKNLCTETMGKAKKFSAVPPCQALERLSLSLDDKKESLLQSQSQLDLIFQKNLDTTQPQDLITVLHTKTSIVDSVEQLERAAKHSVISFTKPPYAMNIEQLHTLNLAQKESMNQGVTYRTIYEVEQNRMVEFAQMVKLFRDAGEEVRIAASLPMKFIVFDAETVVCTLTNPLGEDGGLTAMTIRHPDLANTLTQTFMYQWKEAVTFEEFIARENL
jgi:sugar-specific transcriptional regulator TrmB